MKKIEKKHGPLVPPDTSVHTVASKEGEVDRRLDRMEWEELGHAKRVKPKPSGDDNLMIVIAHCHACDTQKPVEKRPFLSMPTA